MAMYFGIIASAGTRACTWVTVDLDPDWVEWRTVASF